jgi:UTP-glucose-1-phosphate uridylyltransferase
MSITKKINGVEVNEVTSKAAKVVSIGEVCSAIETIIYASKVMGSQAFANIITDKFYSSHEEAFIKMLELAGERAKSIQQDQYMEANKDSIYSVSGLSRR